MKKRNYPFIVSLFCLMAIGAFMPVASGKTVAPEVAQKVASNFFQQTTGIQVKTISLAYIAISSSGDSLYFAYNINNTGGFIIIDDDDAQSPVIGYSTEGSFVLPETSSNIGYWMEQRKNEISANKLQHVQPTAEISAQWTAYINSERVAPQAVTAVAPLVTTLWGQPYPYNALCPGNCPAGCIATAMAQIMRYWKYPAKGVGFHSYSSTYNSGNSDFGTLSADFSSTPYDWAAMPVNNITSYNIYIATVMYQCGVSVNMGYTANNSSSEMTPYDNPGDPSVCSQAAYVNYFGYNAATIQGLQRYNYADQSWINLIEADLNAGRPVQYSGNDPVNGGHSWVCDGYDAGNNLHMNWGWQGSDDGYFSINSLTPAGTGFNFSQEHEVTIGIEPTPANANSAGILSISSPSGTSCNTSVTPEVQLQNFGTSALTSCTINYSIDGSSSQTYNWSGSLSTGGNATVTLPATPVTSGAHSFAAVAVNANNAGSNNTDFAQAADSFIIASNAVWPPLKEGFEGRADLPEGWTIWNPNNDVTWQIVTAVAYSGTNCIAFNNCYGDGSSSLKGTKDRFITLPYNLSNDSNAALSFDVAYAPFNNSGTLYTDTLAVYYSTDCGADWTQCYVKGGITLATSSAYSYDTSCWTPSSSQWRTEVINLSNLINQQSVMFAFENRSGWGGWIYIDNINIPGPLIALDSITVYPNPATNILSFEGLSKEANVEYKLYNILGKEIETGDIPTDGNRFFQTIQVGDLAKGVYVLRVIDSAHSFSAKVIVR